MTPELVKAQEDACLALFHAFDWKSSRITPEQWDVVSGTEEATGELALVYCHKVAGVFPPASLLTEPQWEAVQRCRNFTTNSLLPKA